MQKKKTEIAEKISSLQGFNQELLLGYINVPGELQAITADMARVKTDLKEAEADPNIIELNFKAQKLSGEI